MQASEGRLLAALREEVAAAEARAEEERTAAANARRTAARRESELEVRPRQWSGTDAMCATAFGAAAVLASVPSQLVQGSRANSTLTATGRAAHSMYPVL